MSRTHKKIKFKMSVGSKHREETNGRMDRQTDGWMDRTPPIALPSRLTRVIGNLWFHVLFLCNNYCTIILNNCSTLHAINGI